MRGRRRVAVVEEVEGGGRRGGAPGEPARAGGQANAQAAGQTGGAQPEQRPQRAAKVVAVGRKDADAATNR